jgi:hypothetical protein
MNIKQKGFIYMIGETQQVTERFTKRQFVIVDKLEGEDKFKMFYDFQLTYDACGLVDGLNIGEEIEVEFKIFGKRWQKDINSPERFFTTLSVVNLECLTKKSPPQFVERKNDLELPF